MDKRLYEFALPHRRNNDGEPYYEALGLWEECAVTLVGGFTRGQACYGVWRDGDKIYQDRMIPYRVLCTARDRDFLLAKALKLFDDQLAFFVSDLGTATITYRS